MSSTVIDEMNAAVERHDLQALVDRCHTDAVWDHNPGGGSPEEGVYEGRDAIRALFERILEGWDYMRLEPAELRETGPGAYVVRGRMHCKHSNTTAEIVVRYEQRFEFEDGLMSKGRMVVEG